MGFSPPFPEPDLPPLPCLQHATWASLSDLLANLEAVHVKQRDRVYASIGRGSFTDLKTRFADILYKGNNVLAKEFQTPIFL
ncbi:hypothetical protein ACLOJK_021233 [Asimina triloba]